MVPKQTANIDRLKKIVHALMILLWVCIISIVVQSVYQLYSNCRHSDAVETGCKSLNGV